MLADSPGSPDTGSKRYTWSNTDDLCTEKTGAHMTKPGCMILGEYFAREALKMIEAKK